DVRGGAGDRGAALPDPGPQPRGRARAPRRVPGSRIACPETARGDEADAGIAAPAGRREAGPRPAEEGARRARLGLSMHPAHPPTPAPDGPVLSLPPSVPRVRHNGFTRWLGR